VKSVQLCFWIAFAVPSASGATTVLESVLHVIDRMQPSPLGAIMANVAQSGSFTDVPRDLRAGDSVIVGFTETGLPVTAVASIDGVDVTPDLAGQTVQGLAAGLYPLGSAMFVLPPAGQLSIYDQGRNGMQLQRATEAVVTRIDASVRHLVQAELFPDLAAIGGPVVINPTNIILQRINTTAIGAVNAGDVVAGLTYDFGIPSSVRPTLSAVSVGSNVDSHAARTANVIAERIAIRQIGSDPALGALILNAANNHSDIAGNVSVHIASSVAQLGEVLTTALGAVNGGSIRTVP
jgi:hypothetical protein